MAVVELDILEGTAASHKLNEGWTITRVATVTELNPNGSMDTAQLLQAAEAAVVALTGPRGSPCPNLSVLTYLDQFLPEMISHQAVKMRIVYKGYPLPQFEFEASLNQVEANLDVNQVPIVVSYTYPDDYALDPRKSGLKVFQGGLVQVPTPEASFTIHFIIVPTFRLNVTIRGTHYVSNGTWTSTDIFSAIALYEGTTNRLAYSFGKITGDSHQWLVTRVRGISRDGGLTYEASITYQYREQRWDPLVVYINPDDGKPPSDLIYKDPYQNGSPGNFQYADNTHDIGATLANVLVESDFIDFAFAGN